MSDQQRHSLTIFEAAIFLLSLALGAACLIQARTLLDVFRYQDPYFLSSGLHLLALFFTPPTVVVFVQSFRRPLSARGYRARRPGAVVCAAASLGLTLEIVNHFLDLTFRLGDHIRFRFNVLSSWQLPNLSIFAPLAYSLGKAPGLMAAGAYLALFLSGRWRTDSSWHDQMGRALGWIWIALAFALILLNR